MYTINNYKEFNLSKRLIITMVHNVISKFQMLYYSIHRLVIGFLSHGARDHFQNNTNTNERVRDNTCQYLAASLYHC